MTSLLESWISPLIALLGGLGIFLLGLKELTDALKQLTGDRVRSSLSRLTGNRLSGALTGAAVTAVVQSSSVTTVLAVGFVSAGVMSFPQAVAVVLGANVGTTLTAQVAAFRFETIAFALVAIGTAGTLALRTQRRRPQAATLLGLGLIFVGMLVMSQAVAPLRDNQSVVDLLVRLNSPLFGVLVGAVFCAAVQSSSATTAVAITLAAQDLLTLEAGVAIVIGANVGTCVTAGLAAIGRSRPAVRIALAHVLFNLAGVLIWIGFTRQLAALTQSIGPSGDIGRQLANAHAIFNVSIAVVALPFVPEFTRLLTYLLPDTPRRHPDNRHDDDIVGAPALALETTRRYISDLARSLAAMIIEATRITHSGNTNDVSLLHALDDPVDEAHARCIARLASIGQEPLTRRLSREVISLVAVVDILESIGDVIEIDLHARAKWRLATSHVADKQTIRLLDDAASSVALALGELADQLVLPSHRRTREARQHTAQLTTRLEQRAIDRTTTLTRDGDNAIGGTGFERDVLDGLSRIQLHVNRAMSNIEHGNQP